MEIKMDKNMKKLRKQKEKEKREAKHPNRKKDALKPLTLSKTKRRATRAVLVSMVVLWGYVVYGLAKVSIVEHSYYAEKANEYHFGTMTLSASRGSIYDCNGTALAWSAKVYNIYIDPQCYQEEIDAYNASNAKKIANAKEDNETVTGLTDTDELQSKLVSYLSEKLGITEAVVLEGLQKQNSRYYVLKTQVEKEVKDEIVDYVTELGLSCLGTETTSKRYYPQDELAASVIGFTNSEGDGQYGLEYKYDDYLSGVDGRIVSAQAANGEEMPYRYSTTYEAEDGGNLYLTLDTNMQYFLEKEMAEMVETYEVSERATGIIMNAKTGAIYAMATVPSFDLNNPSDIYDSETAAELDALPDDEYEEAYVEARETQWKNKAISEIMYPGSTFKVVTSSAALEEDVVNPDTDSFYCSGSYTIADATVNCSNTSGHGSQTFTEALTNSCNPAFMEIGVRLGLDRFLYYFKAFGLNSTTGIDLPGEVGSYSLADKENPTLVDVACSAYGQTNKETAIELITAYAASINGGYLLTPYVVDHVVDSNGNTVFQNERTVKRQVISEETSATMREELQAVVEGNPSHNVNIQGYAIGGKSGTAQKLDDEASTGEDDLYVSAYTCFAPADDPEIIMLIMADTPNAEIGYYGSTVVVPYAKKVMEEILPYMGYYPTYTDEEYAELNVSVPLVENGTLTAAEAALTEAGLNYEIVGSGSTIVEQYPTTGANVVQGGTVYLYTVEQSERDLVDVPSIVGMTSEMAEQTLESVGLNYAVLESDTGSNSGIVSSQSAEEGTQVEKGTIIGASLTESYTG